MRDSLVNVLHIPKTADVLLLYPGDSLKDQITLWSAQHPERQAEMSFERSLPKIRSLLRRATTVLVDATEDPSQATDAFLQAVARLGAGAVAMYTETMHDDLELFVRMRGSLFFLGPILNEHWNDYFERQLPSIIPVPTMQSPPLFGISPWQRSRFVNRFRAGLGWPLTDAY